MTKHIETAYSIYLKVATVHLKIANVVKEMNNIPTTDRRYQPLLEKHNDLEQELKQVCEVVYRES